MASLKVDASCKIHALHGFLGKPEDWYPLGLVKKSNDFFLTPDLFKDFSVLPFAKWAKIFNLAVMDNCAALHTNILMGYSLGGRIGLHALLQNPKIWKAAIFISTHPGLKSVAERQSRIIADERWAYRFENESWESLMQAWNTQGVFKRDSFVFQRKELDYSRKFLSSALRVWSLGAQNDLTEELGFLEMPILWIVGAEDIEFVRKAKELKFKHSQSKLCIVSEAAHRLPWQRPENFLLNVTKFIQNLE